MKTKLGNKEYILRRCGVNDIKILNDAYNNFTGRSRTPEQYLWQWVKTPFQPSESWVIECVSTHEIVGHHGVMYLPFNKRGDTIPVGKTENTFVDSAHNRNLFYPAFEKKALDSMKTRFEYIFTTAPDAGKGAVGVLRKRLGYTSVGNIATYSHNIKLRAARLLIKERFPQVGKLAPFLAFGHSLVQWAYQMTNWLKSRQVKVVPLSWDRVDEVESFWTRHKKYYGITPERTAAYLKWRFVDNPNMRYSLIQLGVEKKILGYAVVKHKNLTMGASQFAVTMVDDLIVANYDENNFYLALAALFRYYTASIIRITILLQDDPLNSAIDRLIGFLKKWHKIIGPEMLTWQKSNSPEKWYFTDIMTEGRY